VPFITESRGAGRVGAGRFAVIAVIAVVGAVALAVGYVPRLAGTAGATTRAGSTTAGSPTAGLSWKIQRTPNPAGSVGNNLEGVSCTSATACTAVGEEQDRTGTYLTLAERESV